MNQNLVHLLVRGVVISQIVPHLLFRVLGKALIPPRHRLIVVSTSIDHAVGIVVVGPVVVGRAHVGRIDGKLQHLHVGAAAVPHQPSDTVSHQAQILGDDIYIAQLPADGVEQVHAGAFLPVPCFGAVGIGGNGEILVKATEVVNPNHVIELEAVPHPAAPPLEIGGTVVIPAVQRVTPDLTVGGKGIRRAARDGGRSIVFVQLEQLRVGPHIRAVGRDVDGNVAHDLNMLPICVGLQLGPLLIELELQILLEFYVKVQLPVVVVHGKAPVHPNIFGPLSKGRVTEIVLQRHEQGKIIQPPGVAGAESAEIRIF